MSFIDSIKNVLNGLFGSGTTILQPGKAPIEYNEGPFGRTGPNADYQPTTAPSSTPTPTPTPNVLSASDQYANSDNSGLLPEVMNKWGANYPYKNEIQKYWPGVDPQKVANVIYKESSFRPNRFHVNQPNMAGWDDTAPSTREGWSNVRQQYPSIDVGLMQINTAKAMTDYLTKKGLTYYDLMNNPELNLQVGYDLYSGKIPGTAAGWNNWYGAQALGY